ncbi:MAG: DUF2779 domain-containing protein, partial [Elusimicrobiota bacterium]|nr:DUF2779 domain-containing protein [Elusimicrobiota bacterium]
MENINRSVFLRYIDCPVLAWVSKRKKVRQEQGLNDELLFLEWKNVRQKAALLFPEAISARRQDKDNNSSQQITSEIIQNPQNKTILDASFAIDGFCARADVLQRIDDGSWDLFSIKTGRKSKLKYIWDLAFTAMVLLKAGLKINETAVMHISGEYRLGMDISKLFYFASCTSRAESIAVDFLSIADEALKILQSDEMPKPIFKRQCKNCLLFEECFEGKTKDTIFDLPRLSVPAMDELIEKGITTIEEVPDDFELTPAQKIVKDCVKSKTNYISPTLKSKIEAIEPPYYYLDFESITTILPLYPDIAPHTQIVTQFSIHKCLSIDNVADHFEYIADP